MNRTDARMIAEELAKVLQKEIRKMVVDITVGDMENYISASEAADYLGMSKRTLYNRIDEIPHTKFGRVLKFQKSKLKESING
ncbi:MAG: helix-turn-helix domain-containing protein [Phocaeicola sp.]|nr:helix-turn-helix domain-containing protein [Phocaeicola sp.]